ncbi:MAG TPA: hypothetical protein VHB46_02700 [Burkholderiales bacterium]|nr:hypothetical protein [Burkholderiales bacterium]
MSHLFKKITYTELNAKQQENYNFQKMSGLLAEYGYHTLRLSADWKGADFIAQHMIDGSFLKVQLKGRLTFDRKYKNKELWVCFPYGNRSYFYPHDELLNKFLDLTTLGSTDSWKSGGHYSYGKLSKKQEILLKPYSL